jgi:hypothetical protein
VAFVLKATSLSSSISQSVSQPCKREEERRRCSMDMTLEQENKEVGAYTRQKPMAPLNVAPGITTDTYVHSQTVISAGLHALTLDHRLYLSASACALCPRGYLYIMYRCMCYILFTVQMNFMRLISVFFNALENFIKVV